jgi:hypothetical protein
MDNPIKQQFFHITPYRIAKIVSACSEVVLIPLTLATAGKQKNRTIGCLVGEPQAGTEASENSMLSLLICRESSKKNSWKQIHLHRTPITTKDKTLQLSGIRLLATAKKL